MNVFSIPQNDQSVYYLGQIFGYMGSIMPVQNANLLIGTMFKTFNTIALVLGSFVIVYTTIVGLLATAHEGEFMGKKWSGLWVPLRSVFGIAALFPMTSGYSLLQIMMMWCILQGVGAADTLWTTVLNYTQVAGSPFASINIPTVQISQSMGNLFQGLTCQASARSAFTETYGQSNANYYYCADSAHSGESICTASDYLNPISGSQAVVPSGANNATLKPWVYSLGPQASTSGGACGSMTYCNENTACPGTDDTSRVACAACQGQKAALQVIVPSLGAVASAFVAADHDYLDFYSAYQQTTPSWQVPPWIKSYCSATGTSPAQCCVTNSPAGALESLTSLFGGNLGAASSCKAPVSFPSAFRTTNKQQDSFNTSDDAINKVIWPYFIQNYLQGSDYIGASTTYYLGAITTAVANAIAAQSASALTGWQASAQSQGWLFAGSYYYRLAQMNNNNLQAAIPTFAVSNQDPSSTGSSMQSYRNNYTAVPTLYAALQQQSQSSQTQGSSLSASMPPTMSVLFSGISGSSSGIMSSFMGTLTNTQGSFQPLASVQAFGESLLITAQVIFAVFLSAVAILLAIFSVKGIQFVGTGGEWDVQNIITTSVIVFLPIFMAFISALFVFGGTLAVYVPLIPFIVFTMAAMGWIIGTIEAMVAAPLVAIGILSPGGQHEILGRAEPALMLLLNVVLRPSLMIFGMIFAMLFANAAVMLVNATFRQVVGDIMNTNGLVECILFIAAYTFLIITVLNKCFSLIHLIPERVITWIGGHAVTYGEGEALGEVKRGSEAAAGSVAGGVTGIAGAGRQAASDISNLSKTKTDVAGGTPPAGGKK